MDINVEEKLPEEEIREVIIKGRIEENIKNKDRELHLNSTKNNRIFISTLSKLDLPSSISQHYIAIDDISFLVYYSPKLQHVHLINLGNNTIRDISSLKELKNLQSLDLSNNDISDIFGLKELKNLQSLDLSSNNISDISSLKELKNLQSLRSCLNL